MNLPWQNICYAFCQGSTNRTRSNYLKSIFSNQITSKSYQVPTVLLSTKRLIIVFTTASRFFSLLWCWPWWTSITFTFRTANIFLAMTKIVAINYYRKTIKNPEMMNWWRNVSGWFQTKQTKKTGYIYSTSIIINWTECYNVNKRT